MQTKDFISVQKICVHYNVPISFINTLNEYELIEIITFQETTCVKKEHIKHLERLIRLHFELDINIEGIDAIYNLLKQVEFLQGDIIRLSNRLKRYEGD